jgi:hypothetical protein
MGTLKLAHLKLGVYFVGQSIHFSIVSGELTSVSMIGAAATAVAKIELAEVSIRGLKRIVYIFLVVSVIRTFPKLLKSRAEPFYNARTMTLQAPNLSAVKPKQLRDQPSGMLRVSIDQCLCFCLSRPRIC